MYINDLRLEKTGSSMEKLKVDVTKGRLKEYNRTVRMLEMLQCSYGVTPNRPLPPARSPAVLLFLTYDARPLPFMHLVGESHVSSCLKVLELQYRWDLGG